MPNENHVRGDVLFIDSSHILRLDGDVPFLYLEILPVLKKGVRVHIHDIPFPYNFPHPAEFWVLTPHVLPDRRAIPRRMRCAPVQNHQTIEGDSGSQRV
jgi:hypothetical protein